MKNFYIFILVFLASIFTLFYFRYDIASYFVQTTNKERKIETIIKDSIKKQSSDTKIEVENFKFNFISIDKLVATYNKTKSNQDELYIDDLTADGVFIELDKILESSDSNSDFAIFVSKAKLTNVKVSYKGVIYNGSLNVTDMKYKNIFDINNFKCEFDTKYAKFWLDGDIKANTIKASAKAQPLQTPLLDEYRAYFIEPLNELSGQFYLTPKGMRVELNLDTLSFIDIEYLKLNNINIKTEYKNEHFDAVINHDLIYKDKAFKSIVTHIDSYDFKAYNIDIKNSEVDIKTVLQKDTMDTTMRIADENLRIQADMKHKEALISSKISSLKKLLSKLGIKNRFDFDSELNIESKISFSSTPTIKTTIKAPWYRITYNKDEYKSTKESYFEFDYRDKKIVLNRYSSELLNYKIYSNNESLFWFDEENNLKIEKFFLFDNVVVKGFINQDEFKLNFKSSNFNFSSPDANLTLEFDINAFATKNSNAMIEGDIAILDGIVKYKPKTKYISSDKDIIIIQDMQEAKKNSSDAKIDIRVGAKKYIKYLSDEADIDFMPSFSILKMPNSTFEVYGMLLVEKGSLHIADKDFELEKSEIYFNDKDYTNPHLNINLEHTTLDNAKIYIYITNRLNSPLFIFSSNPQMSQNDIMSYLIFGSSSSSIFDTSNSKTNISATMLGVGVKELFNKSKTFKIDTLNILNNESGTLGYEIGTRFNKNIRLIYKNSDISSLILQYNLNKSIRVEVNLKETSQGVGIYYIKDFK